MYDILSCAAWSDKHLVTSDYWQLLFSPHSRGHTAHKLRLRIYNLNVWKVWIELGTLVLGHAKQRFSQPPPALWWITLHCVLMGFQDLQVSGSGRHLWFPWVNCAILFHKPTPFQLRQIQRRKQLGFHSTIVPALLCLPPSQPRIHLFSHNFFPEEIVSLWGVHFQRPDIRCVNFVRSWIRWLDTGCFLDLCRNTALFALGLDRFLLLLLWLFDRILSGTIFLLVNGILVLGILGERFRNRRWLLSQNSQNLRFRAKSYIILIWMQVHIWAYAVHMEDTSDHIYI